MIYLVAGARLLLGVVFLLAALSKIRRRGDRAEFTEATGALLPARFYRYRRPVAALVITAELATVALVALPATAALGLLLAALVLTAFTVAIGAALGRSRPVSCRCFGSGRSELSRLHMVRNLSLAALAAAGAAGALAGGGTGTVALPGLLLLAGGAVLVAVLLTRLDDLAAIVT
jgi:hypothetical protein